MAGLLQSTPVDTPLEVNIKLTRDSGDLLSDHKLVGSLICLTNTRPDISVVVNLVSQFMTAPSQLHLAMVRSKVKTCFLKGFIFVFKIFLKKNSAAYIESLPSERWCPLDGILNSM